MTAPEPEAEETVPVPDDPFVWLAVFAEQYAHANANFWNHKQRVKRAPEDRQAVAHLDTLRRARADSYKNLVNHVRVCEAIREGVRT